MFHDVRRMQEPVSGAPDTEGGAETFLHFSHELKKMWTSLYMYAIILWLMGENTLIS